MSEAKINKRWLHWASPLLRGMPSSTVVLHFHPTQRHLSFYKTWAIALQRIFLEPNSKATDFVKPMIPALDAE